MASPTPQPAGDLVTPRRLRILVRGAVQGVGFRPFVHRQARSLGLAGWVGNSPEGVTVEVEGDRARIATLVNAIRCSPPANATVVSLETEEIPPCGEARFSVRPSELAGLHSALVLPDLATCSDCLDELYDPGNRRHLYPFINCTQCGPRYSIVEAMPYDRCRTSMRHFPLCVACRAEYEDPTDRRFHAEPNACPSCGPRLALWNGTGDVLARDHPALLAAAEALRQGHIVAVKGIGGFHLLVDARNEPAVQQLRQRKDRAEKPFAVMFPSLGEAAASCHVSSAEAALLAGLARPIVLLRRNNDSLAASVAPGNPLLGALLPYTPLHHLLLRELGFPLVATSGNISDEPIVTDESQALARLGGITDLFLVHDRPIVRPVDDSLVRVVCGREMVLRRSRGYAPAAVALRDLPPGILAVGGHLKTTVALTQADGVILSQHIGDLETVESRAAHSEAVTSLLHLHGTPAGVVARDLHPDYARSEAVEATSVPVLEVQHHLAHVVACMADNGIAPPVLGVAWDGTGFGTDGTIWGGEFLAITESGWRRVAHLRRFRLPGGTAAVREPRRAAIGLLYEAFGAEALAMTDLEPVAAFSHPERKVLQAMLARAVNAPQTSSAGRLFDAFAALCGLRQRASYEGQAAAELEWAAEGHSTARAYAMPLQLAEGDGCLVVDWRPAVEAALADLRAGVAPGQVSEALHNGLAGAIVAVASRVGKSRVALSGGCFQNARLTAAAVDGLRAAGLEPVWHRQVPPNDGGIALGQAVWAAWSMRKGDVPCV